MAQLQLVHGRQVRDHLDDPLSRGGVFSRLLELGNLGLGGSQRLVVGNERLLRLGQRVVRGARGGNRIRVIQRQVCHRRQRGDLVNHDLCRSRIRIVLVRVVRSGGNRHLTVGVELRHVCVIHVRDGLALSLEHVAVAHGTGAERNNKQLVRIANGTLVAVGDVHEVVLAVVHVDDVPHVRASTGSTVHRARHRAAGHARDVRQIAQVLEGLGVSLADHVGGVIVVEHVHELPRVTVINPATRGRVVVAHHLANRVVEQLQTLVRRARGTPCGNLLGRFDSRLCPRCLGGVHRVFARRVCWRNCEGETDGARHIQRVFTTRANSEETWASAFHTHGLVKPVHFVRIGVQQILEEQRRVGAHHGSRGFNGFLVILTVVVDPIDAELRSRIPRLVGDPPEGNLEHR